MSIAQTVHILDADHSRRASIARSLLSQGIHAEVYEALGELMSRPPRSGFILAFDEEGGPLVPEAIEAAGGLASYAPVALYSDHLAPERIVDAMLSGALDYLAFPFDARGVKRLLERMSTSGQRQIAHRRKSAQAKRRIEKLTRRERQVLHALVNGASSKEMANGLGISPRTVEIHRANLMRKLDASTSADAIRIGLLAELDL